jgi:membrane protease YdiL (CAAX protease family)
MAHQDLNELLNALLPFAQQMLEKHGEFFPFRFGLFPFIIILFGWVYNRTQGSILAVALFHASMNSLNTLQAALPMTTAGLVLVVPLAVFAVFYDHMWKKLPADQPAVYPAGDAG